MIKTGRGIRFLSLVFCMLFLASGMPGASLAGKPPATKTLEFNPPPASIVPLNGTWGQFSVRVLKSDGTLDIKNNKSKITVSLTPGFTGVLAGTPVTKTVQAGVATFALPEDPVISYNQAQAITLTATASDIANYSKISNSVTVLAPFAITGVDPVDNAVNVAVTRFIMAIFNRTMDLATVNSSTFYLTPAVLGTYVQSASNAVDFRPAAPLDYNTTYTATVTEGVKDTYGNPLTAGKTWSFTTAPLPAWGTPTVISTGSGNFNVHFSGDTWDSGLAVWNNTGINSNRLILGQWEGVRTASAGTGPKTSFGAGPLTAVWQTGIPSQIIASQYVNGAWAAPQILATSSVQFPAYALAARGGVPTVVWTDSASVIKASRWDSLNNRFGAPVTISTGSGQVSGPAICQDPTTGNVVAAWLETNPAGGYNLMGRSFAYGFWGTASSGAVVYQTNSRFGPAVVCDAYGNATVAWHSLDSATGTTAYPYAARYAMNPPTPGWRLPEQIGPAEGTTNPLNNISLAVDASGAVLALWTSDEPGLQAVNLLSNRYDPMTGWRAAPALVHSGGNHAYTGIAVDPSTTGGPAVAVWNAPYGVVTTSYLANPVNGAWGPPETVSTQGVYNYYPQPINVDGSGKARVLWQQGNYIYTSERLP